MFTPSQSRAQMLLREAVACGASDLHFKADGDGATVRVRVDGRFEKELERFMPNFAGLILEFKTLAVEKIFEDEHEWQGRFSLEEEGKVVSFDIYWFRDKGANAMAVQIFDPAHWLSFDQLGWSERDAATLDELTSLSNGVIVGCGARGSGHFTTLDALLERLAQNGKRVVSLTNWVDPRLELITQIQCEDADVGEQVAAIKGQFDVISLGNLNRDVKMRAALDLATSGHLVLGLVYVSSIAGALHRFLDFGISPDELKASFVGGWSQTLVRRAQNKGRIALFNCMSREEARDQVFEREWLQSRAFGNEEKAAFWRDAEQKIAAGLTTREQAADVLKFF